MNDIEKKFLATLNKDIRNAAVVEKRNVTSKFLIFPESRWLFEIICYHNKTYQQPLLSDSLQTLLNQSTKIPAEIKPGLVMLFTEIQKVTPATNFELLLDQLIDYCKFNRVKAVFSEAVNKLTSGQVGSTIEHTLHELTKVDREFHPPTQSSAFFKDDIPNILHEFYDRLQNPDKYRGVFLGIPSIDKATGGLQKGTVSVIMGAMKSGKSVLMTNLVYNLLQRGKRVYYHVNEGGKKLVYNRYISRSTGLPVLHIRDAEYMSDEEKARFVQFLQAEHAKQTDVDFYIDSVSPGSSNTTYLASKLKELQAIKPLDLMIVDHIGLMACTDKTATQDWEKLGVIALNLKTLAMEHQIPIIAVTHVNREGMKTDSTKDYEMDHVNRSNEVAKHVDLLLSWRIQDPEAFNLQNIGEGKLSIIAARDAIQTSARLQVNTHVMKMEEVQLSIAH